MNQRLQKIAHTVKFTKLANMITLKRSLIAQSQKLVTLYTRPQVRIVSFKFSDNHKRNTTMNVNRTQKHGSILHYITQAKSRATKITVMHHTLTHFNLHLGLIQDNQYLVSIILNNVTNIHVHTAISFRVILIFW